MDDHLDGRRTYLYCYTIHSIAKKNAGRKNNGMRNKVSLHRDPPARASERRAGQPMPCIASLRVHCFRRIWRSLSSRPATAFQSPLPAHLLPICCFPLRAETWTQGGSLLADAKFCFVWFLFPRPHPIADLASFRFFCRHRLFPPSSRSPHRVAAGQPPPFPAPVPHRRIDTSHHRHRRHLVCR